MPWKERSVVEQRSAFIRAYLRGEQSFSALCRYFEISRPTGYKWLGRFSEEGEAGLIDQSRAPFQQAKGTPPAQLAQILDLRHQHPTWGPKKLLAFLEHKHPTLPWPAASTIGDIIRREGLSHPRRKRLRNTAHEQPLAHAHQPNDVWCADFKGWFLCRNGERCDPLTITDAHSRFLIRCQSVPKADGPHVRAIFLDAFREFGLPRSIRTDNGPPFSSVGLAGLSRLSAWWIQLGILPERIAPGEPQQNGRHERFHLTLKNDTASPPHSSLRRQQAAFQSFRQTYNHARPHEALAQKTPASFYAPSPRSLPEHPTALLYGFEHIKRPVSPAGHISWHSHQIHISVMLEGHLIAIRELDNFLAEVHFGPILLGWIDIPSYTFHPVKNLPRGWRNHKL